MIAKIKNIFFDKGVIITLLLSLFCLIFFYGKLLEHPNSTYFSATGDGLQAYYGAVYHVKYDDSFWRMNGMNYPYGENVFFAGCQPIITNTIKAISYIVDISNYTIGIINLIMLFSIVLSALFIYLIFKHLRLPYLYGAIAAVSIAFLSPQIERMGGHFTLTYQFAIPLFLLLLLKFYEAPSLKRSIAIGILTFFMASTHFYFFGFFALFSLFYWLILFFSKQKNFGKLKFAAKHIFIQLLLPFILTQLIIFLVDSVHDRTTFPWGYLAYISNLTGVFFPTQRFYTPLFESFIKPEYPEWEGFSYVGIIGVLSTIGLSLSFIKHLLNKNFKNIFIITDNKLLNAFFWAAVVSLLLAFGYPFKINGLEQLLNYSGPLKQLRGIGRFAWMFYYVINIVAIYKFHHWAVQQKKIIRYSGYIIVLFLLTYDASIMSREKQDRFNNSIAELNDKNNILPENKWLNEINVKNYQAIITLPYFHVGSENVWISTESEIVKDVFIASIKTGLPTTSLILSRVSLSQTYKNVQLVKEPYRKLEIVNDFKSSKPFLVLARENELNEAEKRLLTKCKKLIETPKYNIYELDVETIRHLSDGLYTETKNNLARTKTYKQDEFLSTDSLRTFVYNGFEDSLNANSFIGKGCYSGKIKDFNILYKGTIPNWKDQDYIVSFWMGNFTTDLFPRSTIELTFVDSAGGVYGTDYYNPGKSFSVIDGSWGLIEHKFKLKGPKDEMVVTIWNDNFTDNEKRILVDEFYVKPVSTEIFKINPERSITVNNRTYPAK